MASTLTWDRGEEMTRHREFSMHTKFPVYICDADSPWQRGSNENTNGLLRQYFPKKTDLSLHAVVDVQAFSTSSTTDRARHCGAILLTRSTSRPHCDYRLSPLPPEGQFSRAADTPIPPVYQTWYWKSAA
jgi:hypothetical protein